MNNNPRLQRASTDFTVAFPVREYIAGRNNESGETEEITIIELPATDLPEKIWPADFREIEGYHHTHRTGATDDTTSRHNRERHPVDDHQATVQKHHASALRELARRLKRENEIAVDEAVQRLWARLHPQAAPMGQGE